MNLIFLSKFFLYLYKKTADTQYIGCSDNNVFIYIYLRLSRYSLKMRAASSTIFTQGLFL